MTAPSSRSAGRGLGSRLRAAVGRATGGRLGVRQARTTAWRGRPDLRLAEVLVAYEPCRDGDPDPGEVVWAWVSYEEDPTQGKDRPIVVIGRSGGVLAGVALTTSARDRPDHLAIGTGAWDPRGRPSWAKLDRVIQLDPAAMRREGGVLDPDRFARLVTALRRHHGAAPPRRPTPP